MEETSRANLILDNFETKYGKLQKHCCYCHKTGHEKRECRMFIKHESLKKSNIPQRYWGALDPLKAFLMNETIHGYSARKFYNTIKLPIQMEEIIHPLCDSER